MKSIKYIEQIRTKSRIVETLKKKIKQYEELLKKDLEDTKKIIVCAYLKKFRFFLFKAEHNVPLDRTDWYIINDSDI
jgi:hypothetical protein